jgi:hypothetical protein
MFVSVCTRNLLWFLVCTRCKPEVATFIRRPRSRARNDELVLDRTGWTCNVTKELRSRETINGQFWGWKCWQGNQTFEKVVLGIGGGVRDRNKLIVWFRLTFNLWKYHVPFLYFSYRMSAVGVWHERNIAVVVVPRPRVHSSWMQGRRAGRTWRLPVYIFLTKSIKDTVERMTLKSQLDDTATPRSPWYSYVLAKLDACSGRYLGVIDLLATE